jgi:CPA1 family monovalent cation:H+ antiporter
VDLHHGLTYLILILAAALVVGVVAARVRIPYIVALLIAGLPFGALTGEQEFSDAFLTVLLPPLIFEAAWNFHVDVLARTWRAVLFLAVPGVLLTMAVVGAGLAALGLMPILPALLLGAIVAPTDPIAVIATFKRYAVPAELAITVEGESLFNDGVGVVLYGALAFAAATGVAIEPLAVTGNALVVSFGGAAIGALAAGLAYVLVRRTDEPDLHVVATVVIAYGAYLIAESFHVSGIFGSLLAGIAYRYFEKRRSDPVTVERVNGFWAVAAFFANSIVFLVVGLRIEVVRIFHHPGLVLVAIGLVIVARLVAVYGVLPFLGVGSAAWKHVIAVAGIRGGISIALALSLPQETPMRAEIIDAVYAVVAGSVLVQGLARGPLMARR